MLRKLPCSLAGCLFIRADSKRGAMIATANESSHENTDHAGVCVSVSPTLSSRAVGMELSGLE